MKDFQFFKRSAMNTSLTQNLVSIQQQPIKFNYNHVFDNIKLFVQIDQFQNELIQQEFDLKYFEARLQKLEKSISLMPIFSGNLKQKNGRRVANDIDRTFQCPYPLCIKQYGSEISLNLHIRIKHNGGTKIDRENLAVIYFWKQFFKRGIVEARIRGIDPPQVNLQLPPGFLTEFCGTYQEFVKRELIKKELDYLQKEDIELLLQNLIPK